MTDKRKARLGRGISALLGDNNISSSEYQRDANDYLSSEDKSFDKNMLDIKLLKAGRFQPRVKFSEQALNELAESIRANGIIQPLVVRKVDGENGYEIIAGERRYRAAKIVGLKEVPVIIRNDLEDAKIFEIALIENIQREDLTAIEEAESYLKLIQNFNYSQEELGNIVSKSRSHIANMLRLLLLPEEIKDMVNNNILSMGHARALINFDKASEIATLIIEKNLSVRDTEDLIRKYKAETVFAGGKKSNEKSSLDKQYDASNEYFTRLEKALSNVFTSKVKIKNNGNNKGKIEIFYDNEVQLEQILKKFGNTK